MKKYTYKTYKHNEMRVLINTYFRCDGGVVGRMNDFQYILYATGFKFAIVNDRLHECRVKFYSLLPKRYKRFINDYKFSSIQELIEA